MHLETYNTTLEIEGFNYPVRVKYDGIGKDVQIYAVLIQNEEEVWLDMPFLTKVDGVLMQEIWDNE